MKKSYILKIAVTAAVISAAVFIIFNSSQSGKKSYSMTYDLSETLTEKFVENYESLNESERRKEVKKTDAALRVAAHTGEFFLLGFSVAVAVGIFGKKRKYVIIFIIAAAVTVLIAIADETYQIFVPGRIFDLADVAADVVGGAVGSAIGAAAGTGIKRKLKQSNGYTEKTIDKKR